MSGNHDIPVVELIGAGMPALAQAIAITARITARPVIVVGGLAVLCRLSRPYRVTTDLDTVSRLQSGQVGQLELLVAAGATLSGPSGVLLPTTLGSVQIDILQVTDADFDPLPNDPTDRLHVLSHAWAVETATVMSLVTDGWPMVDAHIAQPAALIAMKLQAAMNRGAPKEGTDFLDIVRLTTDPLTSRTVADGFRLADRQLADDCLLHARRWFEVGRDRTLNKIKNIPEGVATTHDDLQLVAELLIAALSR